MTTASPPRASRTDSGIRRLAPVGLLLLAGPVLFDLGYALHPSLPDDVAGALTAVEPVRALLAGSKVMVAVGGVLIIALVLTLRRWLVPGRGRALATVGAGLIAVGMTFNSLSQATNGYLLYWASAAGVDPAAGRAVVEASVSSDGLVTLPVSFFSVPMFALGIVLFAAALWRAGTVPRWVPVAIVVAGVLAGAFGTGPVLFAVLILDVAAYGTALVAASRRVDDGSPQADGASQRADRMAT